MNFETIEKALLEGYASRDLTIETMFICVAFTAVIAVYIAAIYKLVNRSSFFDRSMLLSLFALSVITAAVILTIQSNIVVSLGMVGALSIVRFRTAIKSPMDLMFLFWSISVGIICGAGYAMIAVIASIVLTCGILLFSVIPSARGSLVLVVNTVGYDEERILGVVSDHCHIWKVCARNISGGNANLAIEVRVRNPESLLHDILDMDIVSSASLVEHDGNITA